MSYQSHNIKEVKGYDNLAAFPNPGSADKIYIDKSSNIPYYFDTVSGTYKPLSAPATAGVSVYVQASSSTKPSPAVEGDELIVTDTGLVSGTILESWLYDATTSTWIQRPNDKVLDVLTTAQTAPTIGSGNTTNLGKIFKDASGNSYIVDYNGDAIQLSSPPLVASASILAANACVNNVVNVPSGNPSDVKTIGTGGDFADFQTALASASVVDGTILKLLNNISTSTTINVNKAVILDFNGFRVGTDTSNPVNVFNVTAGAVLKNGLLTHNKTTNTSVETIITINSPTAPVYVINNIFQIQEFGIVARGQFYIGDNTFSYIGASATNSHRFIMLNGVANESRIYNNEFTASALQGTTRYSNFIYATSTTGTSYSGKLFINDNIQTGGDLRQFYLHDSGVPTNMELYVANNTFNDFNGGIGIVGVNVYNGYSKIGIYNNTQGADSAGNYKGLFYVDGTGAINENVVLEYGDNTQGTTALRADYVSYAVNGGSEIAIKNTITFVDKKEKVSIQDSLSDLGLIIQDLKSRKTYIEGASGSGTKEDPYIIVPSEETTIATTSLTPQHFNAGWVNSSNTASNTVAKLMELSDGSLVDDVDVTWVGHGLDIGEIYYLDSVTGGYTKTPPSAPNYTQQLFIVKDANTIHVDIEQAYVASTPTAGTVWSTGTAVPTASGNTAASLGVSSLPTFYENTTTGNKYYIDETGASKLIESGSQASAVWTDSTTDPSPLSNTGTLPRFVENTVTGAKFYIDSTGRAELIEGAETGCGTVFFNTTDPATATIFDTANPPVTDDPALRNLDCAVYISAVDGSVWTSNGTEYVTKVYNFTTEQSNEFIATAGQTTFTLSKTPIGKIYGYRNGVKLPTAFTWVGTTVTYVPANNGGKTIDNLDVISFEYEAY